jgi:hypothetical protein
MRPLRPIHRSLIMYSHSKKHLNQDRAWRLTSWGLTNNVTSSVQVVSHGVPDIIVVHGPRPVVVKREV